MVLGAAECNYTDQVDQQSYDGYRLMVAKEQSTQNKKDNKDYKKYKYKVFTTKSTKYTWKLFLTVLCNTKQN